MLNPTSALRLRNGERRMGVGWITMARRPKAKIVGDDENVYFVFDGVKIAKRGKPGTPQAGMWITLERGWTVNGNYPEIEVEYDPTVH
jgi:hypothetical protein